MISRAVISMSVAWPCAPPEGWWIMILAREIIKTREQLNRLYADRTGQTYEKIANDMERDFYMSPEEAKTYGLIDQVIAKRG